MSSTLKILNKDFPFIPTDKGVNLLVCKEFKEVFLGVYELECHGTKLIAESVGDDIKLDVEFDGKIYETYFQLKKGDEDAVIFNLKNLGEGKRAQKREVEIVEQIVKEEAIPEPLPLVEDYRVVEEAKVDIEQYKADAIKVINENFLNKKQKIEQLQESLTDIINGRLYQLDDITNNKVNNLRDDVLKSVNEALEANKVDTGKTLMEINAIKDDVATTAEFWSNILVNSSKEKAEQLESLKESVKFEVDTKIAELQTELKSQEDHISDAYNGIQRFIEKTKQEFLEEKTSSFASVEALYEQVNKVVAENIKRAESLVGKKVTQLQSTADKKISDITTIVENRISLLDDRVKDIDQAVNRAADSLIAKIDEGVSNIESKAKEHYFRIEEQTKNIDDIINKNKNDFTTTVRELTESVEKKIKDFNLVAIKKEDLSQLKKQLETRLENESANLKKYVSAYAGGGSVAKQFADGGTMNGTLNVSKGQILSAGQDLYSLFGGTGVSYLSALRDVNIPDPVNGQVLTYSSSIDKWTAGSPFSASGEVGYYGAFYDDAMSQHDGGTTAYQVGLQHTSESNGISLSANSLIFNYPGTYEITFSIQFANSGNATEDTSVWFRKNGQDIPFSNSIFSIPQKRTANIPSKVIGTVPFIVSLSAGESIGLFWHASNNATTYILTESAGSNPTSPVTPGVIVTAKQITLVQNSGGGGGGNYLPLSGGTVTGNVTVIGTLSTTLLEATSANITYLDIKQYELSGFNSTGNITVVGTISASSIVYSNGGNSNQWNSTYTTVQTNSAVWNITSYLPLSGGTLTGVVSTNQDIEITDSTKGIILRSPSNLKYRVTVNDAGELATTLV